MNKLRQVCLIWTEIKSSNHILVDTKPVDSDDESDEELNKTIDRELAKKGGLSTLLASNETPKQTAEDIFAEAAAKGRSVRMWKINLIVN